MGTTTKDLTLKKTKTFRSLNQDQLKIICDKLSDRIEDLFVVLDISDYQIRDKYISCACPIHDGDNASALNIYYVGDDYKGNWKCRTHQCEKIFMGSIIGFVRGVLSKQKFDWNKKGDSTVSFDDTIKFIQNFLGIDDISKIKIQKNINSSFIRNSSILSDNKKKNNGIPRDKILSSLQSPSEYFLNRGFSEKILTRYDTFDCYNPNKEMYNRAVAPIYDSSYKYMIGCTGRSLNNSGPKWRHNSGFVAENHLYNIWFAKEHIMKSGEVILVESPGNVWKLEEYGIHNSLATFGAHLTDKQKMLLDTCGALKLIVLMDNDEAGELARKQIELKCARTYNIENIRIRKNDVAELTGEEIKDQIIDRITL